MSAIGDVLLTSPISRALREAFPEAHLAWAIDERCAPVLEGNPYLDQLVVMPEVRGVFAQMRAYWSTARALPAFDWALDLQGLARSALVTRASRAPFRAGFAGTREGSRFAYNRKVEVTLPDLHRVDHYAAFLETLGIPVPHREMILTVPAEAEAEADDLISAEMPGDAPLVVMSLTAGRSQKCWAPADYAAVADRLIGAHGCRVAVVGGAGDRAPLEAMKAAMRHAPADLVGRIGLKTLAALLRRCDLFLSADTGPMHMAAALKTPTVALFGPTEPALYGPYRVENVTLRKHCRCAPNWRHPVCRNTECMRALSPEEVEAAVVGLLARTAGRRVQV